jgi:hypothetical protein
LFSGFAFGSLDVSGLGALGGDDLILLLLFEALHKFEDVFQVFEWLPCGLGGGVVDPLDQVLGLACLRGRIPLLLSRLSRMLSTA